MFIGEAPGKEEWRQGRPFIGPSGQYQAACLSRRGVDMRRFRLANVVYEYHDSNPDPTPELLSKWSPVLEKEIKQTQPLLLCAIGAFACRWLLGDKAELGTCWGVAWPGGAFDPTIAHRANGAAVMPVFHPAWAIRSLSKGGDQAVRAIEIVQAGYDRVATAIKRLEAGQPLHPVIDQYRGREQYRDVTGRQLAQALQQHRRHVAPADAVIGYDTEGVPGREWSLQVCLEPGTGMCLRTAQPDFAKGVSALQAAVDAGALIVFHSASTPAGCAYDITMSTGMGLDLTQARIFDTMFASYLLCNEPHGAKALGLRWCGMHMQDFEDIAGPPARERQIEWLCDVLTRNWPKPESRIEIDNAGVAKLYTPNSVQSRVEKMLEAVYADHKDPAKVWANMDEVLAKQVEAVCGPMPQMNIANVPLSQSIPYACSDADFELRAYPLMKAALEDFGCAQTMADSMATLPAFHLMQTTGMPASRLKLEANRDALQVQIENLGRRISRDYYNSKPFNPKSGDQVASLMRRRGLESAERTKTGKMSTGKKAIEHLRKVDEAMAAVTEWREMAHNRDGYYNTLLELMQPDVDIQTVRCNINPLGTTTRRLATTKPSLLSFPKHDKPGGRDYGKQLRSCFVAPKGKVFLEADLSQIEVRMLAHESADPVLVSLFVEGRDVHTETAAKMFGVPLEQFVFEVNKDNKHPNLGLRELQRFLSKKITFGGIMYGQTGMGLATQLRMMGIPGWPAERCDGLKHDWRKIHKVAAAYIRAVEDETVETGMVRDCWGMPRLLAAVWADQSDRVGRSMVAEAKRQAVNHKMQSGAQGWLQRGLAWIYPRLKAMQSAGAGVDLCLSVHDSLLFLLDEQLVPEVSELAVEGLTKHGGMSMRVPITADVKLADSWGSL